jgi:deoxyribonuclease V
VKPFSTAPADFLPIDAGTRPLLAAVDAQYADDTAAVACVTFHDWADSIAAAEYSSRLPAAEAYAPGEFFRRELPCILSALRLFPEPPTLVLIDGYVWLDDEGRKGLGAHLFEALGGTVAVVGVAKRSFRGAKHAAPVLRGESQQHLFVTAEGISLEAAVAGVQSMHGPFRIPTLLKRVDRLCREALEPRE